MGDTDQQSSGFRLKLCSVHTDAVHIAEQLNHNAFISGVADQHVAAVAQTIVRHACLHTGLHRIRQLRYGTGRAKKCRRAADTEGSVTAHGLVPQDISGFIYMTKCFV